MRSLCCVAMMIPSVRIRDLHHHAMYILYYWTCKASCHNSPGEGGLCDRKHIGPEQKDMKDKTVTPGQGPKCFCRHATVSLEHWQEVLPAWKAKILSSEVQSSG